MSGADPLVVVDTNVLLSATDRSRRSHAAALDLLDHDERRLALTPQIVREYLAVATRPTEVNGLGLRPAHAVDNLEQVLADVDLLPEDAASARFLMGLAATDDITGKQVHDANVVAVAVCHGAAAIVTDDAGLLSRFASLVRIEELTARDR